MRYLSFYQLFKYACKYTNLKPSIFVDGIYSCTYNMSLYLSSRMYV